MDATRRNFETGPCALEYLVTSFHSRDSSSHLSTSYFSSAVGQWSFKVRQERETFEASALSVINDAAASNLHAFNVA